MANYDLTYEGSEVQGILDTGEKLKADGYILMGGASPSTLPGTPTKRVAYIGGPGTYSNFGSTVVVPSGSIGVFKYDDSQWVCTVISPSVPVSTTVQDNDTTVPTGKAVKTAVDGAVDTLQGLIDGITDNIENGYVYAGIATPSTEPVTGKVFYLALQAGQYTHFDNTAVMQGINIFKYNGSSWLHDAYTGISDKPIPSDTGLVKAGGTFDFVMDNGSAFDISKYFASGSTLATYENLSAALTDLDSLDEDYKRGGMSIKYVQSSDNKYIQARLMADSFTTDVTKWQGVDAEIIAGSKNLAESGAVHAFGDSFYVKKGHVIPIIFTDGGYISGSGISQSNDFARTQLIDVSFIKELIVTSYSASGYNGWFDKDGNHILSNFRIEATTTTIKVPFGARYLACSGPKNATYKQLSITVSKVVEPRDIQQSSVFDVNAFNRKDDGYSSKQDARAAVPADMRGTQMVIRYLLTDGCWYTEVYKNSEIGADYINIWASADSYWKQIEKYDPSVFATKTELAAVDYKIGNIYGDNQHKKELQNGVPWNYGNTSCVCVTEYIPVHHRMVLELSVNKAAPSGYQFGYGYQIYNSAKERITEVGVLKDIGNRIDIIWQNAAYIRFAIGLFTISGTGTGVIRVSGSTADLILTGDDVDFILSENLSISDLQRSDYVARLLVGDNLSKQIIERSYVSNSNGNIVTNWAGFSRTGYINVFGLEYITVNTSSNSTYNVFYDKNKNFISAFSVVAGYNKVYVPTNAHYCICSGIPSAIQSLEVVGFAYNELADVVKENISKSTAIVSSAYRGLRTTRAKNLTLVWGSDFHGNLKGLQSMIDIANYYGVIDGVLNTGDTIETIPVTNKDVLTELVSLRKPFFNVIGNHDNGYGSNASEMASAELKYNRNIAPYISLDGIVQPSDLSAYPCYYYKDFASYKIRMIVADAYDVPKVTYNSGNVCNQDTPCISQAQANFIAGALLSMPEDYSVIIAVHCAAGTFNIQNKLFSNQDSVQFGEQWGQEQLVLIQLVNAFTSKQHLQLTVNYTGSAAEALAANDLPTSYDIDVDFSSRTNSNFICYLGGHYHMDYIGLNTAYSEQMAITVACGSKGADQTAYSDIPRSNDGASKNLYNIISFDTVNKKINLVRIGADFTTSMVERKVEQLDY